MEIDKNLSKITKRLYAKIEELSSLKYTVDTYPNYLQEELSKKIDKLEKEISTLVRWRIRCLRKYEEKKK